MATDKKPVTSYLSSGLEEQLITYCTSKGLVRDYKEGKTKPQLGTAVVEILESFFGMEAEGLSPSSFGEIISQLESSNTLLKKEIESLKLRLLTLESLHENTPSEPTKEGDDDSYPYKIIKL